MKENDNISKVCIISDSFVPKKNSAAGMLYNLSHELLKNNIEVTCIFGSDKNKDFYHEKDKTIKYNFRKIKIISSNFMSNLRNGNYYSRFFYEILLSIFLSIKIIEHKKMLRKIDLIIWYSPSAFLWLPTLILKKISSAKIYLILRDIFPDWLINTGILKNKYLINFLKIITYPQLKIPNIIGCESYKDTKFIRKKVNNKKVETLYNWPSLTSNSNKNQKLKLIDFSKSHKTKKKVIAVYTGNDSISHDLNSSVMYLRDFFKKTELDIELVFNRFSNVNYSIENTKKFIEKKWPLVSETQLPYVFKQSDVGIVSLNSRHKTNNLPGKFVSYIQFGLPVICFANFKSELVKMILDYNCGCVIDITRKKQHNNKLFTTFLNNFHKNKILYSNNSLKLFNDYFSIETVVTKLLSKKI